METDQAYLQGLLDVIGSKEGSILVRGPKRWIALEPGPIGYVLVINDGGFPEWVDPATVPFAS
jgi:hypothetical protein